MVIMLDGSKFESVRIFFWGESINKICDLHDNGGCSVVDVHPQPLCHVSVDV